MGACASKRQPQPARKLNQLYDYVCEFGDLNPMSCYTMGNYTMRANYANYRQYLYDLKDFTGQSYHDVFGNIRHLKYTKLSKDGSIDIRRSIYQMVTSVNLDSLTYQMRFACCTVYPIKTDYIVKKIQRWWKFWRLIIGLNN